MNTLKASLFVIALLPFFNPSSAQTIVVTNSTCPSPGVCVPANQAIFGITNLIFDPPVGGDVRRRFEAFWVPGDGNYIQFDPSLDALSLVPTYNYPATGNYEATAYLTGKYTNHIPPARAAQKLNITQMGAATGATSFKSRLGKRAIDTLPYVDIFSNHDIRKKNLTTFVISWPGDVNPTGIYLFFDGFKNSRSGAFTAFTSQSLSYKGTDVPLYFNALDPASGRPLYFNAGLIHADLTANLRTPNLIPGVSFNSTFYNSMPGRFRQFVYFPAETAKRVNMPPNFTENRLFVVLSADETFVPQDSFMNFVVMLTGPAMNTGNDQLPAALSRIYDGLNPAREIANYLQQPQYVQAVADIQLEYLTTFDPNELTVQGVKQLGSDEYEVSFQLEMCNKGRLSVDYEDISLTFPSNFHDFVPDGFLPTNATLTPNSWTFRATKTILGVEVKPTGEYEESNCESITFKAKTNCDGLRSLWKSDQPTAVQSCVLFSGGISTHPECHATTGIDSSQFGCLCCRASTGDKVVDTGDICWPLWLLLILVVLFVVWWVYKQNNS